MIDMCDPRSRLSYYQTQMSIQAQYDAYLRSVETNGKAKTKIDTEIIEKNDCETVFSDSRERYCPWYLDDFEIAKYMFIGIFGIIMGVFCIIKILT